MNIDEIIRKELQIEKDVSVELYKNSDSRQEASKKIIELVNNHIDQIPSIHEKYLEDELKDKGCVLLENFMSEDQVDEILETIKNAEGYNNHIAATAYNKEPKIFSEDLEWNILSYTPDILLKSKTILNIFVNPKILSLIQSYLGCFPTLYSFNCVWSKFNGQEYRTQNIHRDFDDFKFLALFVILTDIDDNNGPHVFYPKTQDGSEISEAPVIVKGKKGTAFLADTYAYHNGMPLVSGQRCLLWIRYGLYVNNIHYKDKNNLFAQNEKDIFNQIENNDHNKYLLRAFINQKEI